MQTMILNHYPPVIKQIKDIQQIAKAEDIEFTKLNKDEIRLRSATVKRMRSRIKYIVKAYERGEMTLQEVNATMQSYFGLIKHCTNEGLRENIINGFVLHCTDAARAKARESR